MRRSGDISSTETIATTTSAIHQIGAKASGGSGVEAVGAMLVSTEYRTLRTFRGGFSSLLQTLADINVYAKPFGLHPLCLATQLRVEIEVTLSINQTHQWSRGLDLEIGVAVNPENYQILDYEMTWNFNPRNRNNCDIYTIEARSPQYAIDFTFPDAIRNDSQILAPATVPDEPEIEVEVVIVN